MKCKVIITMLSICLAAALTGCKTSQSGNTSSQSVSTPPAATSDTGSRKEEGSIKSTDTADTDTTQSTLISSEEIVELENDVTDNTDTTANNDTPSPAKLTIGDITLSAELLSLDSKLEVSDIEDIDAAMHGNSLYILDKSTLYTCTTDDSSASKSSTTELESKYERIDTDPFGNICLSNSKFNAATLDENGSLNEIDVNGRLSMSKVMNFGLVCNGKNTLKSFSEGTLTDWSLHNTEEDEDAVFSEISDIEFSGNHILIGGIYNDGSNNQRVVCCDYDGNLIAITDNAVAGSSISSMTKTDSVIMVVSSGRLSLWNTDGSEIGQVKNNQTAKLFGTDSPVWINDVFSLDDGSVLAVCTVENDNGKGQVMLFKVTSF